eukprot:11149523-Lingulodinium_polyedra.AAC.1
MPDKRATHLWTHALVQVQDSVRPVVPFCWALTPDRPVQGKTGMQAASSCSVQTVVGNRIF